MPSYTFHTRRESIDTQQWNNLIDSSSFASYFQSPACYDFYASLSFMKPFVYAVSENNKLKALLCGYIVAEGGRIKQFFSRRAIAPGGVLLAEDISNEVLDLFLKNIRDIIKKKSIYIEIRNYKDYSTYKNNFELAGFEYNPHLNFHLDSSNADKAFKNLKSNKRRYIRLSNKEGVEWFLTKDEDDIKSFYKILKSLYSTKIKFPLFPIEFFINLSKTEEGKFILIKYNDKIIGGGVYVVLKNKAIYEWFICGEDGLYKNVHPSILATWAGIEYAAQQNIPLFDFMGAGKPDIEYGVRKFKSEFGGELVEHGRFLYVAQPFLYRIGKETIKLIRNRRK